MPGKIPPGSGGGSTGGGGGGGGGTGGGCCCCSSAGHGATRSRNPRLVQLACGWSGGSVGSRSGSTRRHETGGSAARPGISQGTSCAALSRSSRAPRCRSTGRGGARLARSSGVEVSSFRSWRINKKVCSTTRDASSSVRACRRPSGRWGSRLAGRRMLGSANTPTSFIPDPAPCRGICACSYSARPPISAAYRPWRDRRTAAAAASCACSSASRWCGWRGAGPRDPPSSSSNTSIASCTIRRRTPQPSEPAPGCRLGLGDPPPKPTSPPPTPSRPPALLLPAAPSAAWLAAARESTPSSAVTAASLYSTPADAGSVPAAAPAGVPRTPQAPRQFRLAGRKAARSVPGAPGERCAGEGSASGPGARVARRRSKRQDARTRRTGSRKACRRVSLCTAGDRIALSTHAHERSTIRSSRDSSRARSEERSALRSCQPAAPIRGAPWPTPSPLPAASSSVPGTVRAACRSAALLPRRQLFC
eukprot:scaffold262_cov103-Isochrysis_galbana.AAC.6